MADGGGATQSRFDQVVEALGSEYGVSRGKPGGRYGHWNLLVDGKLFARVSPGHSFVVRLSTERIHALEVAGAGRSFPSARHPLAPEWLVVKDESVHEWIALAREAARFVRSYG